MKAEDDPERAEETRLAMPEPTLPGMIPTLNDTGFMTEELDEYSLAFVDYAGTCGAPVLDIGCAYGVATLPALAAGATVTACDMEPRHLEILARRVPPKARQRLTVEVGRLPSRDFARRSFDAVLAARVLHFLDGRDIETSVRKMASWLVPGGKAFLITDTVYSGIWAAHAPIYEERKAQGLLWPGEIHDAQRYLPERARARTRVRYMNFLDPDILRRVAEEAGLDVERVGFVQPGAHEAGKTYGDAERERAAVVAVKPKRPSGRRS